MAADFVLQSIGVSQNNRGIIVVLFRFFPQIEQTQFASPGSKTVGSFTTSQVCFSLFMSHFF